MEITCLKNIISLKIKLVRSNKRHEERRNEVLPQWKMCLRSQTEPEDKVNSPIVDYVSVANHYVLKSKQRTIGFFKITNDGNTLKSKTLNC